MDNDTRVFTVGLIIQDIDSTDHETAARQFLAAIMSADWSAGGMTLRVNDISIPDARWVKLDGDAVAAALRGEV